MQRDVRGSYLLLGHREARGEVDAVLGRGADRGRASAIPTMRRSVMVSVPFLVVPVTAESAWQLRNHTAEHPITDGGLVTLQVQQKSARGSHQFWSSVSSLQAATASSGLEYSTRAWSCEP
eukprot:scaffold369076_cov45-Prasinocladus_malaysianus.AAC.1